MVSFQHINGRLGRLNFNDARSHQQKSKKRKKRKVAITRFVGRGIWRSPNAFALTESAHSLLPSAPLLVRHNRLKPSKSYYADAQCRSTKDDKATGLEGKGCEKEMRGCGEEMRACDREMEMRGCGKKMRGCEKKMRGWEKDIRGCDKEMKRCEREMRG